MIFPITFIFFFFFNDTATTEIYTLSLHDALPIFENFSAFIETGLLLLTCVVIVYEAIKRLFFHHVDIEPRDRKSTRLNSSHLVISYAVFCLKKKKMKLSLL